MVINASFRADRSSSAAAAAVAVAATARAGRPDSFYNFILFRFFFRANGLTTIIRDEYIISYHSYIGGRQKYVPVGNFFFKYHHLGRQK